MAETLFDKIWKAHVVAQEPDKPAVLYVNLHLLHEVTSPQAFAVLRERNLSVRRPNQCLATEDHSTPTDGRRLEGFDSDAAKQIRQLRANCQAAGIALQEYGSAANGIVHVVAPELGYTQPGSTTIVCGDSHTATHGAFGALAFGIGTTEVGHVLATQCLLQTRPKTMLVQIEGLPPKGVGAKDIILALIAKIGTQAGTGYVLEYAGEAVRGMDMESRMTLCNMSIEAGARAGMVAPDDTTFSYLAGRDGCPKGSAWDSALSRWRQLPSDEGARYDRVVSLDVSSLAPFITFGTNPGMGMPVDGRIPQSDSLSDASERSALEAALRYMGLAGGASLLGQPIDAVFIGSCTNGRISDFRAAARILKGRKVSSKVRTLIVPGSQRVKREAEAEGLDRIFREAGADWREPGCSMCIAMNGDNLEAGQYAVSTSNRNFEGRQGKGARTFLASPATAAASAIAGCVADPRLLQEVEA